MKQKIENPVVFNSSPIGCSVRVAYSLSVRDLDSFLLKFGQNCATYRVLVFSDRESLGNGIWYAEQLAKYGKVVSSEPYNNPVHNSQCRVWIWNPSQEGLDYIAKLVKEENERYRKEVSAAANAAGGNWQGYQPAGMNINGIQYIVNQQGMWEAVAQQPWQQGGVGGFFAPQYGGFVLG